MGINTIALIVAAGSGSRFGSEIPKQYLCINEQSLLAITAQKFCQHPKIDGVVIVINEDHHDFYKQASFGLNLLPHVIGGKERQDSVRNGLLAIEKYHPENVLIHDAARIFVTTELITILLEELQYYKGVIPGYPITDSLKLVNESLMIEQNVSRETFFGAQTPQVFKYQSIVSAHRKYKDKYFTDDASLLTEDRVPVKIVATNNKNFKITTDEDLVLANLLLGKLNEKQN